MFEEQKAGYAKRGCRGKKSLDEWGVRLSQEEGSRRGSEGGDALFGSEAR